MQHYKFHEKIKRTFSLAHVLGQGERKCIYEIKLTKLVLPDIFYFGCWGFRFPFCSLFFCCAAAPKRSLTWVLRGERNCDTSFPPAERVPLCGDAFPQRRSAEDETEVPCLPDTILHRALLTHSSRYHSRSASVLGARFRIPEVVRSAGISWPCCSRHASPLARRLSDSSCRNCKNNRACAGPVFFGALG